MASQWLTLRIDKSMMALVYVIFPEVMIPIDRNNALHPLELYL